MTKKSVTTHIRQAFEADVPVITNIIREAFHDVAIRFNLTEQNCPRHPSNCSQQWVIDAMQKGIRYYLIETGGQAFGCVAVEQATPETCYLERLSVVPAYRRHGYGRTLAKHAISAAKSLGAKEIGISIIAEQAELKEWYRNLGFSGTRTATFKQLPFEVLFMSMAI